ncbi:MAG: hypothetical protein IT287_05765 [Bdellovibrionaceae bacterium]|nr:hypothetical protein [Pseudobdellovibrionaceae bacterium]
MNFSKMLSIIILACAIIFTGAASHALDWKGVFISGDDSIENFDNGREDLTALLSARGSISTAQLSSSDKYISEKNGVYPADAANIIATFENLNLLPTEGCFVHMTSHGAKGQGFYLSKAGILPPVTFETLINGACGEAPTVILVSACYSGQFITEGLKGANRIILTAARPDRPSFGCSADTEYTYWDGCLLEQIPNSKTWTDLYKNTNSCITKKEAAIGAQPSEPQAYFGENTKDWTILH